MNHPERFRAVMSFQNVDRLPRWEWAMWWDRTIARWHEEGLPRNLPFHRVFDIAQSFGLDPYQQLAWFKNAPFRVSGNTWDLSADPDRSRVGAGLCEPLVAVLRL